MNESYNQHKLWKYHRKREVKTGRKQNQLNEHSTFVDEMQERERAL